MVVEVVVVVLVVVVVGLLVVVLVVVGLRVVIAYLSSRGSSPQSKSGSSDVTTGFGDDQ